MRSVAARPKKLSAVRELIERERRAVTENLEDTLISIAETLENEEQLHAFLAHVPDGVQRTRVLERLRPLLQFKIEEAKETVQ